MSFVTHANKRVGKIRSL